MTESIVFFVPGAPRGKQRQRKRGNAVPDASGRTKTMFTPKKTEDAERIVRWAAKKAFAGRKPFEGAVRLDWVATYEFPRSWSKKKVAQTYWKTSKPDRDNIEKLLADALKGLAWGDDSQIAAGSGAKCYTHGAPGLRVEVAEIE